MSLTRSSGIIQRHWRGWKVRSELPRLRRFQGANLNAGQRLDQYDLNYLHPLWSTEERDKTQTISFNDVISCRSKVNVNSIEETDYVERGKRPLCKVVKIVEAASHGKPLFPIFMGETDKLTLNAIDLILVSLTDELCKGRSYRFNNPSSIKIRPTSEAINAISIAHTKFRYFYGFTTPLPPIILPTIVLPTIVVPPLAPVITPLLARQPSRSLAYIRLQASLP